MAELQTDVRYIKGIGEQRAKALARLGIRTLRDLIAYFPRAYEDRRTGRNIAQLQDGESAWVEAMVAAAPTRSRIRRGLELVKLRAVDAHRGAGCDLFQPGLPPGAAQSRGELCVLREGGGPRPAAGHDQPPGGAGGGRAF